jgi:hypothetical protein
MKGCNLFVVVFYNKNNNTTTHTEKTQARRPEFPTNSKFSSSWLLVDEVSAKTVILGNGIF